MWSIIAASVVDLPEPVVPVSSMIPRSSSASSLTTGGSASSSIVRIRWGIARQASEIDAALAEGVDPEARDVGDFEGEVGLVLAPRIRASLCSIGEQRAQACLGVFGGSAAALVGGAAARIAVDAVQRRASTTFRCRSEPPRLERVRAACA